jgi:cytochrome-b5 reductase
MLSLPPPPSSMTSFVDSPLFNVLFSNKNTIPTGTDVIRSYTPIPAKYITKEAIESPLDTVFLIKTYTVGTLTKYLKQTASDEIVNVSTPKGNLDLNRIKAITKFSMFAAGSGITPMISVIEHLLERNTPKM